MQGSIAAAAHALGLPVADVQAMIARGDIEASPDGERVPWREVSRLAQARPKEPVERRPVPEAWAGLADRLALRPPATIDRIEDAARLLQIAFPADYIEFMTASDGAEGVVGASYLQLWPAGDLVGLNRDYAVDEFVPGYVLFGSDGGGELFAFARDSTSAPAPIVELPKVSMKPSEARARGSSFREFLSMLGEGRQ